MANEIKISVTLRGPADRQLRVQVGAGHGLFRAVRSGAFIAVTGTVGVNVDGTYSPSLADQTRRSLAIVRAAVESLGGRIEHVIRTRMYVTNVSKWEQVAEVHGEVFAEIRPATTIVEVAKLIDSEAQIEIEADAVVP